MTTPPTTSHTDAIATPMIVPATSAADPRCARTDAIRNAAIVRERLGPGARYRLLRRSLHEIVTRDRKIILGAELEATIKAAKASKEVG